MSAVEYNVNGKATLAAPSRGGGMGADNTADQENVQVCLDRSCSRNVVYVSLLLVLVWV